MEGQSQVDSQSPLEFETVQLETLDGFGFQNFCAHLFEKLSYGRVEYTPYTGDEGRDLIIHLPNGGLSIVECKHQPKSSVGRPVVQKLHSAVISSKAERGILVTTGRFTNEAVEHAAKLSPPIELVDRLKLNDLASQARIKLSFESNADDVVAYHYAIPSEVSKYVIQYFETFESSPTNAAELVNTIVNKLDLCSTYLLKYDIRQDFQLARNVIKIDVKNKPMMIDAETGQCISDVETEFLVSKGVLIEPTKLPNLECPILRHNFKLDVTSLKSLAESYITKANTSTLSYVGDNNVSYSKACEPSPRSIYTKDIKQVLVPRYAVSSNILRQKFSYSLIATPSDAKISTSANVLHCSKCNQPLVQDKTILCNSCGNLSDLECHGFVCKNCDKTICSDCSYWRRHRLFFKEIICESCATILCKQQNKFEAPANIKSKKSLESQNERSSIDHKFQWYLAGAIVFLFAGIITAATGSVAPSAFVAYYYLGIAEIILGSFLLIAAVISNRLRK
jgi:restriction system protein